MADTNEEETVVNSQLIELDTESLANLLQKSSLKDLLEIDKHATELFDDRLAWFHEKITRDSAEQLLLTDGRDGHFLVRESVTACGSYVLSLVCNKVCSHYQIQRHGPDAYFSIDEGPFIHGLEMSIENYYTNPDGLPVKLQTFSKGKPPPSEIRKCGRTNILHKAIKEGCKGIEEIIKSNSVDINSKNSDGQTPLHMASFLGQDQTVLQLLSADANVHYKDSNGDSTLQLACRADKPSIVSLLINNGGADPQTRATKNGWVALHEAASNGHIECIKILLAMNAPHQPRTKQNETPADLAAFNNHGLCVKMLENYKPPPAKVSRTEWLHDDVDRTTAVNILQNNGSLDGLFLVRRSLKKKGFYVLTMVHNNNPYNFEIRTKMNYDKKMYYIDDGPYLDSLEHVIDHYLRQADGLPIKLSQAVSPISNCVENQINNTPQAPPLPARDITPKTERKTFDEPPTPPPASSIPANEFKIELINLEELILGREIGEGEFGSVLKGIWKDKKKKQVSVAVKTLREDNIQTGTQEFLREAAVMMGLNHHCIVRLIGVVRGPPFMLVQELVPLGSMLDFLLDYPERINPKLDLYLWAAQIACGMMYLESKRFVHRDLAARNILLASKRQAKISDFGLSRTLGSGSDYYRATAGGRWPVKWYAPESINYGTFSHASDMWSFGVTLWEMFSFGQQPYGSMTGAQVVQFIEQNQRLPRTPKCPSNIYSIMLRCWSHDVTKRPTFEEINTDFSTDPEYENIKDLFPHSIIV